MTHEIWHIICGGVGARGPDTGTLHWPAYDQGLIAFRLEAENKKLEKRIQRIVVEMAEQIEDIYGGPISEPMQLDGGYYAIGIGNKLFEWDIPPIPTYADALFTYGVSTANKSHAQVSYITNELDILRYRVYSLVYCETGGEIHHDSYAEEA